jgi:hypothetical protein
MLSELIKGVLDPIVDGVLRFIPDKNAREQARAQFESQMLVAMTSLVQGQLEINKVQAQHGSIFVAGARPAIMWICGAGIGWNFVVRPIMMWVAFVFGVDLTNAPELDTSELTTILLGMLGLGGLRTYEKRLGVARNSVKQVKDG